MLALLMFSAVINYVDRGSLSTAAPILKDELGLSTSQLGLLLSSFFWSYTAFMVVSGWLADHWDVNWVLATGFFIWCAATAATGFVHGFAALFVVRLVLGMGESVSFPCYSTLIARHVPEHRRGIANAVLSSGMCLGPAVGMFTVGMLMARFGWRLVFIVIGLSGLLWLPAWLKWMPREVLSASSSRRQPGPGVFEILRQRSAWGTSIGYALQVYLWYLLLTWTPYYLVRVRHFSIADTAKITGAAYLCTAIVTTMSGWLADRWVNSGGSQTLVRKTFTSVGLTSSGLCLLFCALAGRSASVVWLFLAFSFYGYFVPHTWAMVQTLAGPRASGKWFSLANFFGSLSGILAPAITGFIVNSTGSFFWAFAITSLLSAAGALSYIFVVGPVKPVAWFEKVAVHGGAAAANSV